MRKRVFLAPFALLACAAHQRTVVGLDQVPPGSKCEQSAVLNGFVGQAASTELAARMMAAARAPKLRWVAAGASITMDYGSRRLTVQLDSQNRVASATCG
jgi:Peptidase inhibitor I78 family